MSAHSQTYANTHIQTHSVFTLCQKAEWAGTKWKAFPGYPGVAQEEWVSEGALVLLACLSSYASYWVLEAWLSSLACAAESAGGGGTFSGWYHLAGNCPV